MRHLESDASALAAAAAVVAAAAVSAGTVGAADGPVTWLHMVLVLDCGGRDSEALHGVMTEDKGTDFQGKRHGGANGRECMAADAERIRGEIIFSKLTYSASTPFIRPNMQLSFSPIPIITSFDFRPISSMMYF